MKLFLPGILFLVWLFLGYLFHQKQQECCLADTTTSELVKPIKKEAAQSTVIKNTAKQLGPILFNYGQDQTVLGKDWSSYKNQLLSRLKDGELLEITGRYTADEKAPAGFANMGEARADKTRIALGLSKDRVILKGLRSSSGVDKNAPYEAVSFRNLAKIKSIDESVANQTVIRFPYNSTNKLADKEVEDYLRKVAKRVKASGERIQLTGHTDSSGRNDYNMNLGKRRANIIKQFLVRQGVKSNQIVTLSKGESEPVASNSTANGMAQNRRTVLQILK